MEGPRSGARIWRLTPIYAVKEVRGVSSDVACADTRRCVLVCALRAILLIARSRRSCTSVQYNVGYRSPQDTGESDAWKGWLFSGRGASRVVAYGVLAADGTSRCCGRVALDSWFLFNCSWLTKDSGVVLVKENKGCVHAYDARRVAQAGIVLTVDPWCVNSSREFSKEISMYSSDKCERSKSSVVDGDGDGDGAGAAAACYVDGREVPSRRAACGACHAVAVAVAGLAFHVRSFFLSFSSFWSHLSSCPVLFSKALYTLYIFLPPQQPVETPIASYATPGSPVPGLSQAPAALLNPTRDTPLPTRNSNQGAK